MMYSGFADADPGSGAPNANGGIRASTFRIKRGNMDYDNDYSASSWSWPVMKGNLRLFNATE